MNWPMHHSCSGPLPGQFLPGPVWVLYPIYIPMPPVQYAPPAHQHREDECQCECDELAVPQQLDANGDAKPTAMVGGLDDVYLTLEYLVEADAEDTAVIVTAVQPDGTSSTWTDTGAGIGFHVQEQFLAVKPGTKLTLEVKDIKVTARLRWCETICC